MDQVIVTLEGKDHKIGYGEHTMCMLPVPHGTTRDEGQKPCKTCFPADEQEPEPEPVLSIASDPESLGHYENPDADPEPEAEPAKPAKKATKDAKA